MGETGKSTTKPNLTDDAFKISLYIKGVHGALEIIAGILLLVVKPEQISHLANATTRHELSEDPKDFIAGHILKSAHGLTGAALTFGGLYVLSHGLLKMFLVVEVLRDQLWAYIALISVTGLFVVYQTYRLTIRFSLALILLNIFDIVIIYLTQKEYRKHKARHEAARA